MKRTKTKSNAEKCVIVVYRALCLIMLLAICIWCYYDYSKDEDVSFTNKVDFEMKGDNIYPTMTLCFGNPFLVTESQLKEYNLTMSPNMFGTIYREFLNGRLWEQINENFGSNALEIFRNISYDDVTKDLMTYTVILGCRMSCGLLLIAFLMINSIV